MAKNLSFCPNCGASLAEDAVYCPDCGNALKSIAPPDGISESVMTSRTKIVGIFSLIFAVFALISGFMTMGMGDTVLETLKNDPDSWSQILTEFTNMGYSPDDVENMIRETFTIIGAVIIAGGVAGAIGGICSLMRKFWIVGLVCLIIATLSVCMSIIGLIVGIVFVILYAKCKPIFE